MTWAIIVLLIVAVGGCGLILVLSVFNKELTALSRILCPLAGALVLVVLTSGVTSLLRHLHGG
jgi:choline-glycine betaine transporter